MFNIFRTAHQALAHAAQCALALACVIAAAAGEARAAVPARLIDAELKARAIELQSLGDRGIGYFGEDRVLKRSDFDQAVALRFEAQDGAADESTAVAEKNDQQKKDANESAGLVLRTDGQRLAGTWQGGSEDGQAIHWKHKTLGAARVSLEALAGFHRPGAELPKAGSDDQVRLANGDTLTGFITKITDKTLSIEPENADQPVALPLERVSAVRLSNNTAPWPEARHTLELADGSHLAVNELALHDDKLHVTADWLQDSRQRTPRSMLRRLVFTGAGWRLMHLSDLPREVTGGGEVFGVPMTPRPSRRGLRLHAPVTVRFTLPDNARRFAATIILAPDVTPAVRRRWADCTLTLKREDQPAKRWHLKNAASQNINLPFRDDARTLTLQLETGKNGPVLDRVLLASPRLLVRER
jgi:hypothetical protein